MSGTVLLLPGDMIVVAPEDAHKPRCAAGEPEFVRKVVVKVKGLILVLYHLYLSLL